MSIQLSRSALLILRSALLLLSSALRNPLTSRWRLLYRLHCRSIANHHYWRAAWWAIPIVTVRNSISAAHEHDKEEDNIIDYGDGRYLLQANTTLTEFNEFFNSSIASDDYDTIAGLVISGFSYLPKQMSEITLHGFQFKVLKTDNRRLHLLEVQHKLSDYKAKE